MNWDDFQISYKSHYGVELCNISARLLNHNWEEQHKDSIAKQLVENYSRKMFSNKVKNTS